MLIRHTDGRETIDNYVGCCMTCVSARTCRNDAILHRAAGFVKLSAVVVGSLGSDGVGVSGRKCGTSANVCIAVSIPTTHYEALTISNISTTATNITPNPYVNHK